MAKGYKHVTRDERCQIYALKSTGLSQVDISLSLGRHISTISRELSRNTGKRGYRFEQANNKSVERRANASRTPLKMTVELTTSIKNKLIKGWSPEQISGRLKAEGILVSHETIYKYIWKNKKQGDCLYKYLRRKGKKYNKRSSLNAGRGCIPGRVDIKERPSVVEAKSRIGDWEGDTVIGAKHKGAILTYVDRHSKFTLIKKIQRKTAQLVTEATKELMSKLPHPVLTITYDNGKEFAGHKKISRNLNAKCYFATPYCSWERGLNEHTNGLIRQYLPKSTTFTDVTDDDILKIQNRLNHRPRKVLNYRTPFEVFFAEINDSSRIALHC